MGLAQELEKKKNKWVSQLSADDMKATEEGNKEVVRLFIAAKSLQVGDKIPSFTLPNTEGRLVSSRELLKKGVLIISFYRGWWSPFCDLKLHAFQRKLPEIEKYDAHVVAISPQLVENSLTTAKEKSLTFELLSDEGNRVARDFGIVFALPEKLRPIYKMIGIDLRIINGDDSHELPVPVTYIVSSDGTIIHFHSPVNVDYTVRLDPQDVAYVNVDYMTRLAPGNIVEFLKKMNK